MPIRAIFRAIKTDGEAPFNVIHAKVFYPAMDPETDDQRNSGILAPLPADAARKAVIFLNGINCPPESYSWLAREMCDAGHIFVTFSWITDVLPGGIHGLTPGLDMRYMRAESYGQGPTGSAIKPIIDDLAVLNSNGLFAGQIDLDHIVLGGHSAGGSVALTNTKYFPQIKAVFSYGAHTQGSTMMGFVPGAILPLDDDIPILMLGGDSDGVISWSARRYGKETEDSSISLRETYERGIGGTRGDRYLAIVKEGTHFTFADPKDATTGRPFLEEPGKRDAELRSLMSKMLCNFIDGRRLDMFSDDERVLSFDSK